MPRPSAHRDSLRAVADAQAGLVTAAQLAELGLTRSTASRRSAPGGMWTRVLPGIHLVTGGLPDRHQRELASLLYAGPPAVLTGTTALRHHGLRAGRLQDVPHDHRHPDEVFVLVPHYRRRVSTTGVRIERTRRMPDPECIVVTRGLALAPPARAAADAARRMRDASDVAALVLEGVRRDLWTPDDLEQELTDGSRRGSAHLRAALGHSREGLWSSAEADAHGLIATTGLPTPLWNPTIVTLDGRFVGIPDAWFDEVGLAVEIDSEEHHADGDAWRRTLLRQQRYARAGILCVPITTAQLSLAPGAAGTAIVEGYAAAAARPRPRVRIAPLSLAGARSPRARWGG